MNHHTDAREAETYCSLARKPIVKMLVTKLLWAVLYVHSIIPPFSYQVRVVDAQRSGTLEVEDQVFFRPSSMHQTFNNGYVKSGRLRAESVIAGGAFFGSVFARDSAAGKITSLCQ
jgi:hypothetical protein